MSSVIFPITNLLAPKNNRNSNHFAIDKEIENRIKLAQQDHVSVQFKQGIIRIILADIGNDVEKINFILDVRENSFAQFVASEIANDYNLASHIMFINNQYSLVVVSQLGGPKDSIDCLSDLLENFKIK